MVRLPRPDVPWFRSPPIPTQPPSYELASLMLPTTDPALNTARMLPPDPTDTWHDTELSDTHSVPSHPVSPIPAPTLYPKTPRPPPLTVTLPCPVVGQRFTTDNPVIDPESYVPASDTVPDTVPAVTTARMLPPSPQPALHATELSDVHAVDSHPVSLTYPFKL
eukprot:3837218-Rhodomonas_salina.2